MNQRSTMFCRLTAWKDTHIRTPVASRQRSVGGMWSGHSCRPPTKVAAFHDIISTVTLHKSHSKS